MKKAVWKAVETSDVVRSLATREYTEGWGRAPRSPRAPERGPQKILKNFEKKSKNGSASVEFGIAQCSNHDGDVCRPAARSVVTLLVG